MIPLVYRCPTKCDDTCPLRLFLAYLIVVITYLLLLVFKTLEKVNIIQYYRRIKGENQDQLLEEL